MIQTRGKLFIKNPILTGNIKSPIFIDNIKSPVPTDNIQNPFFYWHYFIKEPKIINTWQKKKISWYNHCLNIAMTSRLIKTHWELS